MTHGFTGADLAALCREAAMAALRRVLPRIDLGIEASTYSQLLDIDVSMADFTIAMHEVEPSAMREVLVEIPDVGWDDIGGLDAVSTKVCCSLAPQGPGRPSSPRRSRNRQVRTSSP